MRERILAKQGINNTRKDEKYFTLLACFNVWLELGVILFRRRFILERVLRDILRNNRQIANQRTAMTMDALRYLLTRETKMVERSSKNNSSSGKPDSWAPSNIWNGELYFDFSCLVNPRLVVNPHSVYMRVYEGFAEIKIDVTVKGGIPKPEVSLISFRENSHNWRKCLFWSDIMPSYFLSSLEA